jgi:lipopolysaccharide biosynthesis glycosyltransferase
MQETVTIYIGWDSREPIAADVCRYSILKHASIPVDIQYLKQDDLRMRGFYRRDVDALASTEFTFTRFLIPALNNYKGTAIFMDSDMILIDDIAKLLEEVDPTKAVTCVQHDYTPPVGMKMDGQQQLAYPRKNWSSMVVWNCAHESNSVVTVDSVNDPDVTGAYLHRFSWLNDKEIGAVGPEWNWLTDWYIEGRDGTPKLLHYTEGGPWFDNYKDCDYAATWNLYHNGYLESQRNPTISVSDLTLPDNLINSITKLVQSQYDPHGLYYNTNLSELVEQITYNSENPKCIGVIDAGEVQAQGNIKLDVILESFLLGSAGVFGSSKHMDDALQSVPVAVRGIAKKKVMKNCLEAKRDFYYIDTGYFGNLKHKKYHRITKNALQYSMPLNRNCRDDRFLTTGTTINRHTPGRHILLCPPSQKALSYWDVDLQEWLESTVATIKKHTDRPIVIREKQSRHTRVNVDTIEMALAKDVHCLVTYNSIAAVESLIFGKPVFTMGPNAAAPLANTDLSRIERPMMPSYDEIRNLCCNLAYNQFTPKEMQSGLAWRILQENYSR